MMAALSFFIKGCVTYQRQGINPIPSVVELITTQWREQQDIIGQFITDNLEQTTLSEHVSVTNVFNRYRQWMESIGEHAWTQRAFAKDLEERGMPTTRDQFQGRLLWGWKIKESAMSWPHINI
jgi:phage/plasmid-associated DNA primase